MRRSSVISARLAVLFSIALLTSCGGSECVSGPLCGDPNPTLTPTSVATSVGSLSFDRLGATQSITATVRDQNGSAMSGQSIVWASTNLLVAIVDGAGNVTSTGNGTTLVSATSGSLSASVTVTVEQVPVGVTISPNPVELDGLGSSVTLTALVLDGGGFPLLNPTLDWASADESIVAVSVAGVAIAMGEGSTEISVGASNGGGAAVGGTASAVVTVPYPQLTIAAVQPPRAEPGSPYSHGLMAAGGDGSYTWIVAVGSLPAGLSLNPSTGVISGTPSAVGSVTFVVQVSDGRGDSAQRQITIDVFGTLAISTTTLPSGVASADYGTQTLVATGGDGIYTWGLGSGSGPLPDGLSLGTGGDLTGTPTAAGSFGFLAEVASGDGQVAQQILSIDVDLPPALLPAESCSGRPPLSPVTFEDANVTLAVRAALGLAVGEEPTCASVAGLTELQAGGVGITSLVGVQNLTGATYLYFADNAITDLSPLGGLIQLIELDVGINAITDISALSGLTNLEGIRIRNNTISDLSPLSGLTNLNTLDLAYNTISNVSPLSGLSGLVDLQLRNNSVSDPGPLSGLTNLTSLSLTENLVTDVSALSGLTNLTWLALSGLSDGSSNQISSVAPLSGLTRLDTLYLRYNTITDVSPLSGLTGLMVMTLYSNSISDISALSGLTSLTYLNIGDNTITDITAVSGMSALERFIAPTNTIIDVSALSNLTSLTQLLIGNNPGLSNIQPLLDNTGLSTGDEVNIVATAVSCRDALALEAKGVTLTHSCTPAVLGPTEFCSDYSVLDIATFTDVNLEAAVISELGVGSANDLTCGLVTGMTQLTPQGIGALTAAGVQNLTSATWIDLRSNSITDLSPFADLPNLQTLVLASNGITNVGPLAGITTLQTLGLFSNTISDIGPLGALSNLRVLTIQNNSIVDISVITSLPQLEDLYLYGNSITNIAALASLNDPRLIRIDGLPISDLSPISSITNLNWLGIDDFGLTDLSLVAPITTLGDISVRNNSLTDISALLSKTLRGVYLSGNPLLSDISALLNNGSIGSGDFVDVRGTLVSCTDVTTLLNRGVDVTSDCPGPQQVPDPLH
jgi:Leucine-rich repeat (LRR) protein